MSTVVELILVFLFMVYAATQVAVLAVWGVHLYCVHQGKPGLLAPRWSFLDLWVGFHLALLLALAMLATMYVAAGFLVALFLPQSAGELKRLVWSLDRNSSLRWMMLLSMLLVQNVAFVATAIVYVVGKYGLEPSKVGLSWDWQAVRKGILWGGLAFLITPLVELLSVGVLRVVLGASTFQQLMDWERQTVALDAFIESLQPGVVVLGFVLTVAVVAPIGEELFFRGFVFNLLRNRLSMTSAVWLSAGIFALLHVSVKNFLPILVIGVLLARLYARTGSLWSSVVMHGTFNLLSAVAAFVFGRG
ncbi:MAG: CPBP family intramembrane metalloprotease [Chthonomonadetes bacterium]|nr:CPBP family intramembrane metalloprotease [Chthonomonadetes bacterium]